MGKLPSKGLDEKPSEGFTVSLGVHRNLSGPICEHPGCTLLAGHRRPHTFRDGGDEAPPRSASEGLPPTATPHRDQGSGG